MRCLAAVLIAATLAAVLTVTYATLTTPLYDLREEGNEERS